MTITIPQVAQYAAYLALLIIAGGLEYLKLLPAGTVGGLFLLIVGHFFGNTPTVGALNQNTAATRENTAATATNASLAPVAIRTSAHPNPIDEPQPIILTTPLNRSVPPQPTS
ncbi:MAG TPA: hypothetical protein VEL31_09170 [Ktedonobacteraceae bacterium]|nr:hypothetical protein [Ktedonobacteraceae bacterium]